MVNIAVKLVVFQTLVGCDLQPIASAYVCICQPDEYCYCQMLHLSTAVAVLFLCNTWGPEGAVCKLWGCYGQFAAHLVPFCPY